MSVKPDFIRRLLKETSQKELLPRFERIEASIKQDGSVLTEADLKMQEALTSALELQFPYIHMLGEESTQAEQEQALNTPGGKLWVLDPLDGTSNFSSGFPFFSVSLALVENGITTQGYVYDPVRDECFWAVQGHGAYINDEVIVSGSRVSDLAHCLALVDFKRLTPEMRLKLCTSPPYRSQRSLGSVALDWCWIAADRAQLYLHGGQKLWDYAAACLILQEAGGKACTLEGENAFSLALSPRSAVTATTAELHQDWNQYLHS